MTRKEAEKLIRASDAHPIVVAFLKRTDKTLRIMVCRSLVPSPLTDRITVKDLKINGIRCIPVEGIVAVSTHDRWEAVQ